MKSSTSNFLFPQSLVQVLFIYRRIEANQNLQSMWSSQKDREKAFFFQIASSREGSLTSDVFVKHKNCVPFTFPLNKQFLISSALPCKWEMNLEGPSILDCQLYPVISQTELLGLRSLWKIYIIKQPFQKYKQSKNLYQ